MEKTQEMSLTALPDLPASCLCDPTLNAEQKEWVQEVCRYLALHSRQQRLSLSRLSGRIYVSATYLSALFHKYTGRSFKSCLIALRIQKACQLLLETNLYVYEVAEQTGYSNAQYFSILFKKCTGFSPSEYRAQHR